MRPLQDYMIQTATFAPGQLPHIHIESTNKKTWGVKWMEMKGTEEVTKEKTDFKTESERDSFLDEIYRSTKFSRFECKLDPSRRRQPFQMPNQISVISPTGKYSK